MKYERTTCSYKAYMRGFGQKVIAFTYFKGKAEQNEVRHYVQGIQGNLEVIGQLYGQNWTMRLRSTFCVYLMRISFLKVYTTQSYFSFFLKSNSGLFILLLFRL